MSKVFTLKGILLEKLNRVLNPNFDSKFIWALLTAGIALIGYQRIVQLASSLVVLSGDIYLKLSLDSGTDSVFIVIGSLMIFFSIFIYLWRLFNNNPKSLKKYKTLSKAARDIRPLMDENRRIFTTFGPNSGAGSTGELRHDYEVWQELKLEQIAPNNDKILSLLNRVKTFGQCEAPVVSDMKSHIQAFKTHCKNPNFDYSKNQFPLAFSDLILGFCADHVNNVEVYKNWFVYKIAETNLNIEAAYIYGSALYGQEKTDVDILIKTTAFDIREIKNNAESYNELQICFVNKFGLKLHLKVYSELEKHSYQGFKAKLATVNRVI
jgi:hypothetical protein